MQRIIKELYFSPIVRLTLLIFLLMVVFGYGTGRFIFVQAFNNQVNIFPGSFSAEDSGGSTVWKNIGAAFYQDLAPKDGLELFNRINSAYLVVGKEPNPPLAPPGGSGEGGTLASSSDSGLGGRADEGDDSESAGATTSSSMEATESRSLPVEENTDSGTTTKDGRDEQSFHNKTGRVAGKEESGAENNGTGRPEEPADSDLSRDLLNLESIMPDSGVDKSGERNNGAGAEEPLPDIVPVPAPVEEPVIDSGSFSGPETGGEGGVSLFKRMWNSFNLLTRYLGDYGVLRLARAENASGSDNQEWSSTTPEEKIEIPGSKTFVSSIVFSDFNVPLEYQKNGIGNINLRMSLAGRGAEGDGLTISYSLGNDWQKLGKMDLTATASNAVLGDYFQFALPDEVGWEDIGNLRVKISYSGGKARKNKPPLELYLDAVWLEVSYNSAATGEISSTTADEFAAEDNQPAKEKPGGGRRDFNLDLLSKRADFKSGETPAFKFRFRKKRGLLARVGAGILDFFRDEYRDMDIAARVLSGNEEESVKLRVDYLADGEFTVKFLSRPRQFRPGRHSLELIIRQGGKTYAAKQDFTWGVLAFNVNKSIYSPGEAAYLQMGVLDDNGDTICDAALRLIVKSPSGQQEIFSTNDGTIKYSGHCAANNVTDIPDYYAYYQTKEPGAYEIVLTAWTNNGERAISDSFMVADETPFAVERVGPTRIYPWAGYAMIFNIKANVDFRGNFVEYTPASFQITNSGGGSVRRLAEAKEISWPVDWQKGQTYRLRYVFDAPNISPEFYLLGPAELKEAKSLRFDANHSALVSFQESRQWQIAADAENLTVLAERISALSTSDAVNYTNLVTASSSQFAASTTYFIYVTAGFAAGAGVQNRTEFEIRYGTSTVYHGLVEPVNDSDAEAAQISWFDVYQQPMPAKDIGLYFRANNGGTSQGFNAQIFALSLDLLKSSDWQYASNTASQTHTTAFATTTSITLTSADGAKDWLVLAMEELDVNSDTINFQGEIYDGAASSMGYSREGEYTGELLPYVLYRPFDDVATNTTFSLRVRDDAAGTNNTHQKSKIFALNLDAFASHKTYYADINTQLGIGTWTEIGNLNSGGNYTPQTSGDQIIFAAWINDVGSSQAETDDRLQVNNITYPTGWSWTQGTITDKTSYDFSDEIYNNILTRVNIPVSGYPIDLDAQDLNNPGRYADEVALAVFSVERQRPTVSADEQTESDNTVIANGGWSTDSAVKLKARGLFADNPSAVDFYFELLDEAGAATTTTSPPANACSSATAYNSCTSKIWTVSATATPWYNANWPYRKKITINASQVATTTNDFPVLVSVADNTLAYAAFGGHMASSTGADIVITDSDGTTTLPYEREYYASSTGQIVLWVRTDISSTTDKIFYLYYGNAEAADMATTTGVWGDDYVMVYHLGEPAGTTGSGSVKDSTGNTDGTPSSGIVFGAGGRIGPAVDFSNGTGINCGTVGPSLLKATTTISYWIYEYDYGSPSRQNPYEQAYGGWSTMTLEPGSNMSWYHGSNGGNGSPYENIYSPSLISNNNWIYVTAVRDPDNNYTYSWYRNGDYYSGGNYDSAYPVIASRTFLIGDGYVNPLNGRLDEFRVANAARSAGWIKTEYNNQSDPASFLSFSDEETEGYVGIVSITAVPDRGGAGHGYKWQVIACATSSGCSVWDDFNSNIPNFQVDTVPPTAPGNLTLSSRTNTGVTLNFGASSTESNFSRYRLFYKYGSGGVSESDSEHTDANLNYQDYNSATSTTISGLQPGTDYWFNIWAYDAAGNKASGTEIQVTTSEGGRARTVQFLAGVYSGDGASGQLTDSTSTFSAFNFSLAESDASIKDAYIVFEAQFEGYTNYSYDHIGYNLAFDTCQEPCTANAFSGSGRVLEDDNTVLAYRESESNQVRLLLDVTNEAQLAAYSGGGVNLEGQVGYRIEVGATATSVASARAKLVVTYTYDDDNSESITNTVIYPLASTASGDSGSRRSSQSDDCTLDADCPLFSYKMEIPEFSTSPNASRLSQWFTTYNFNDSHGANDVFVDVNIEGTDATSSTYVHESVLGGTQGVMPAVYFSDVSGFSENANQNLEYHAYDPIAGGNYYLLGGEAAETYTASATAALKTRTVSFPLGVVNNGVTGATTSASVVVYFPENGKGTGVVDIKKAWFRIISNTATSVEERITVATKVGDNPASANYIYKYNAGSNIIKSSFNIIHIIPASDYAELEEANLTVGKTITLTTANTDPLFQGGVAAELMITYTYSDEVEGYLNTIQLFAGQAETAPTTTVTVQTANAVMPEPAGTKTILAGALLANYLLSDSNYSVPGGFSDFIIDANLATSSPVCTTSNSFIAKPDNTNSFTEFYRDISANLTTSHNQSYWACYANNGAGDSGAGAKMGGQLIYTYLYDSPQDLIAFIDDQYKSNGVTAIANHGWTDESEVKLSALATDANASTTQVDFYFELLDETGSFSPATTSPPADYCSSGTAYNSCSPKIWLSSFSSDNFVPWYDTDWLYRKKLTVNADQVEDDLSGFPLLATTTDSDLAYTAFGGHMASSTGADIVITDASGTTTLAYEREYYSSSTGAIILWIKADLSSSTNRDFYIYYGNFSTTTDQQNPSGIWGSNYVMVHHLEEPAGTTGGGSVTDSAGNADGTPSAGLAFGQAGQIGTAVDFSGGTGINCGSLGSPLLTPTTTVSFWIKSNDVTSPARQNPFDQAYGGWGTMTLETTGQIHWYFGSNGGNSSPYGSHGSNTGLVTAGPWIYVVAVRSPNGYTYTWYKNGSYLNSGTYDSSYPVIDTRTFTIGDGYVNPINGEIDEFRVAKVTRSDAWIKTEYNNQSDPANFVSFSTNEESVNTQYYQGLVTILSIPDRGTASDAGYKWQMMACDNSGNCVSWQKFGIPPNFKVDTVAPTAPGNLTLATTTPTTITLILGATTTDTNFSAYKIFYKKGISGVTVSDTEFDDSNFDYIDYNGATTTTITGLEAYTQYVINIWAYDAAGNKTSAPNEIQVTTAQAAHARARTVQFLAGAYSSGNGQTGQLTNTNQTFATFNFKLAENEVEIRDAYVLFEAQFEAYHSNSGDYSGYNLAFDACVEPCTADAFAGSGRVLKDDNTVLAYDETSGGSMQARLLFDVTDEAQLAAYSGDGAELEAQVGYRLETDTATNSIATARAVLLVTYAFNNDNSESFTNTVIYPLESTGSYLGLADSGTKRASTTNCTKNSNCPLFNYNFIAPEAAVKLSQWFKAFLANDSGGSTDIQVNVNIEGTDIDSNTYIHEAANGGTQGIAPAMLFPGVSGFSPNTAQTVEYYAYTGTKYLMGGEVAETYLASTSAAVKTRTAFFPLGVITSGQSITTATGAVDVYFPENGEGSGVVDIKKAWLRIISNDTYSADYNITVSTKVGTNAQSSNYIYPLNLGSNVVKSSFNIIHIIPANDYSELEAANAVSPKTVTVYVTNSDVNLGGVAAELMLTYTYTSEASGYLASLDLYGGQSSLAGNEQSVTELAADAVLPELRGDKTVRAGGLLASYLMSAGDNGLPANWFSIDANLATDSPACAGSFSVRGDGFNAFADFYRNVSAAMLDVDNQSYSVCYYTNGAGDSTAGAKMNAVWRYTYQWDAVPPFFTQNDWRWYDNTDAVQPTSPKAAENTAISNINIGDELRLRLNIGVTQEDLAALTQTFKLQYATGTNCATADNWSNVGPLTGSQAWIGYNNPAPADGQTLTAVLLASSTVAESYEETNPSASNPATVPIGGFGEWDWVLYNNAASSTTDYCFRVVKGNGAALNDYLSDSYPRLTTAASNTPPGNAYSLAQYHSDESTQIPNMSWVNEDNVKLRAAATDPNINETITLYFELIYSTSTFTTATSEPSGACTYGTAFNDCDSKIWFVAPGSPGDYRTDPYVGTTSITNLPESASGYKWQVLACDDSGACANNWTQPGSSPNFKVDTVPPTPPGDLQFDSSTATSVTMQFGASTTEDNFDKYRLFYKAGASGVTESDNEQTDSNLNYQDYNGATTTTIINLSANTAYVFNIWAYDLAGNKATATNETVGTTSPSFNPPTGTILSTEQKTDGSGAVDITIKVTDVDLDDTLRAKIVASTTCNFGVADSGFIDPTIDETDENVSATKGDPAADNNSPYQVGTSSGWIVTSGTPEPGKNFVLFDWLAKTDLPAANGTYCLGLVANDTIYDQAATATLEVTLDNVAPTAPGALSLFQAHYNRLILSFGASASDTNPPASDAYRIFYRQGTSTNVTESDNEHDDANLDAYNYSGATSTEVTGLDTNTWYTFNIWSYDAYGNKASATEIFVKTNAAPTNISADNQYRSDATTTIANNSWVDENNVVFKASAHDQDSNDLVTFYFEVITATGTFATATTAPANTCSYGTDFSSCPERIWAVATTTAQMPDDWYNKDWLYRKQITIHTSQVATTTNLPILATTTDTDLAAYARPDGYDILFTDVSGTTTLPYEREYFNASTGELAAWIKAAVSSTTDTVLYMYYGNSACAVDSATTTDVWDSSFRDVWHLSENVVDEGSQANAHLDSTANGVAGDQYGNNEIGGHIYQAQDFDGLNDYISIGDIGASAGTFSFWVKNNGALDLDGGNHTIIVNNNQVVAAGFNNPTIYVDGSTNYSYFYSQRLTINASQVVSTENDFVVLATTTDADLKYTGFGGHVASSTGADIYFTAADGITTLDYEREKYSSSTGELVAWIRIPTLSSTTDTVIYMFYGDSTLTSDQQNPSGVWGDDYVMVHHLEEPAGTTGSGSVTDSAGNADGTPSAGLSFNASGRIGPAVDFSNGTGINCGTLGPSLLKATTTISYWIYEYDYTTPVRQNPYEQAYGGWSTMTLETSGSMSWYHGDNGGNGANYESIGASGLVNTTNAWLYIVATRDPDNNYTYSWYRNGNYYSGGTYNSNYPNIQDQTFTIGDGYVNPLNGRIDEFRVLSVVRPAGWIKTEYNNQKDVNSFISFGSEQVVPLITGSGWHQIALVTNTAVSANNVSINKVGANYFSGYIDELEFSSPARHSAWVKTIYNSQGHSAAFLSFGAADEVVSYYEAMLVVSVPDNPSFASGYKWQVMACDDDGDCSSWDGFNATVPNFKIDTTSPTAPGPLTESAKTSNSVTLKFGAQTQEDNFSQYRIFYATTSPVSETDSEHSDSDLNYIDYNGTSNTVVTGLAPETTYWFNIWAYDVVGHKASSTEMSVTTSQAVSSPGVAFYTKGTRTLYYRVWDGNNWGAEQAGPNLGSSGNLILRHLRARRSDDGGKIAILAKASSTPASTAAQEWWGTVYRFAADDFVGTAQLGATTTSVNNPQLVAGCLAALSSGEFFAVRSKDPSDGTEVYSWNAADGWVSEGDGPNPIAVLNGCRLVRRPDTDNYLLMTFDDDRDVNSFYYYGGSTYSNLWTLRLEHATVEEDADNYVGEAFFDPSDNTRGALNFSNSASAWNTQVKYFSCNDTAISYGAASTSPSTWADDFVHGEFAADPGGTGIAYYAGRDIDRQLNVYQVDISADNVSWSIPANSDNISAGELYVHTNDSQKPFALTFYKSHKGAVIWTERNNARPHFRQIDAAASSLSASTADVPGAPADLWTRVRLYDDPVEDEFLAVFQNDNVDYAAVFYEGGFDRFYATSTNPGSHQVWTYLATSTSPADRDDENIAFAFTAYNAAPDSPTSLAQYKSDASTTIANGGWTNESTVKLAASATDPDTYEVITLYLQLLANNDTFATSTSRPTNACAPATAWNSCNSKIWVIATSSAGDYSVTPFTATATITSIATSSVGYKWQVLACDDDSDCSNWTVFNSATPNFYVDTDAPVPPGGLTISAKTSNTVTLHFGAAGQDENFLEYRIFYKAGASGVSETDNEHDDSDLDYIDYNGTTDTIVTGLSPTTQYVFNIWIYDKAGNKASATPEVSTTTSAAANLAQVSYLWENDDGGEVNANSSDFGVTATATNIYIGERLNARIQIENNGGDLAANKVYKLQYENYTDNPGVWNDVGAATAISYSGGLSGANGDIITGYKAGTNGNTWVNGTWHENVNQTGAFSLSDGEFTEFVFAIQTANAAAGKTYRLRLYNSTDDQPLGGYSGYPALSLAASDTQKYSKGTYSSLPTTNSHLTYYLDPEGYADVGADDGSNRDELTSVGNYPIFMFAVKHTNNSDAISATWNGSSTVSASDQAVFLQVYRFGSPDQWLTVASNTTAAAGDEFTLSGTLNSSLSGYYDTSYWTYWRIYQQSGSQTLSTDYINISFSAPTSETKQLHYRWRADDGTEASAGWLEDEDTGSPVNGPAIGKGSTTRLRLEVANTGAGSAANYTYRLEYASSSDGCVADFSAWTVVPVTATSGQHFEIASSTYFDDASTTAARLTNSEGYAFITGDMVEDPSNSSAALTLTEDEYTEIEYAIFITTNAENAMTYCFRLTNAGAVLDSYNVYPAVTLSGSTNNAPAFSVLPTDNDSVGASASTSPTNEDSNVTFRATAGDSEGDDYYLAVCRTDSVSPGNDAPPTCSGGEWCVSAATASGTEASCDYTAAASSEVNEWYAFVCDKKTGFGIAKCSASSQGSGDAEYDSPFVINHRPDYTLASTTVDFQDPGGTFQITAYATDDDTAGGADTLRLYVCTTNSAGYGAGCTAETLCSEMSTSSPNASCTFSTSTPALAGTYTYYAFVFDNHGLAASPSSNSGTYTVNNTAPVLGTLILNNGNDITLNLKGAGDKAVSTVNTSVQDLNGCHDLDSAVATIYMSNVSGGYNCTQNDNDCYKITTANCVKSACTSSDDMIATFTCTANMKYFVDPTDDYSANNPWKNYNWLSYLQVYDGANYSDATSTGVEVSTNLALEVAEPEIDFGSGFSQGDDTGNNNATTTVVNYGNCPLDTNISGTDMSGVPSGVIDSTYIEYSLTRGFSYNSGTDLLNGGADVDIAAPKATTTAIDSEDKVYWGIGIPWDADSSLYTGNNTFQGLLDGDGW